MAVNSEHLSKSDRPTSSWIQLSLPTRKMIFGLVVILCLHPSISPPLALIMGLLFAQVIEHPYLEFNHKATSLLLKIAVVGLGFGMNVFSALKAGREGVLFTIASIAAVLLVGFILGRLFKIEHKTAFLVSAGTAICGGSAIAALSPIIAAEKKQISVAMGVIFILNSVALILFPSIGHVLHLSPSQFGLWCALAIHDTSSVVGAAGKYGDQALQIATTVKLARALWIVPVAVVTSFVFNTSTSKVRIPYFILLFILAMMANTYLPFVKPFAPYMVSMAKTGLSLTLFLIGSGLSLAVLKAVGLRPLLQGITLWILISAASLWAVLVFIQ